MGNVFDDRRQLPDVNLWIGDFEMDIPSHSNCYPTGERESGDDRRKTPF